MQMHTSERNRACTSFSSQGAHQHRQHKLPAEGEEEPKQAHMFQSMQGLRAQNLMWIRNVECVQTNAHIKMRTHMAKLAVSESAGLSAQAQAAHQHRQHELTAEVQEEPLWAQALRHGPQSLEVSP